QFIVSMEEYGLWKYLFPGYDFDFGWKEEFSMLECYADFFGSLVRKPNLCLVRFLLIAFSVEDDDIEAFYEEAQIPRSFRDAMEQLRSIFYQNDSDEDEYTDFQWYRAMSETPTEVIIAAYIKTNDLWRGLITTAFRNYKKYKILCSKQDIRDMEGYQRGQLNDILSDLLAEKKRGGAETLEAELSYIKEQLKNGKYKGDVHV
ncbi:MAG: hypothetical protein IJO94_07385, partial [Firmicutes bacterium]|nr:hypothetical protein [Bacillota bacterium]